METGAGATSPLDDVDVSIHPTCCGTFLHVDEDGIPTSLGRGPLGIAFWDDVNHLFKNPLQLSNVDGHDVIHASNFIVWKLHDSSSTDEDYKEIPIVKLCSGPTESELVKVCTGNNSTKFKQWYDEYKDALSRDLRTSGGLARFWSEMGLYEDGEENPMAGVDFTPESYLETVKRFQKKHPYRICCHDDKYYPIALFYAFSFTSPYDNSKLTNDNFGEVFKRWLQSRPGSINDEESSKHIEFGSVNEYYSYLRANNILDQTLQMKFSVVNGDGDSLTKTINEYMAIYHRCDLSSNSYGIEHTDWGLFLKDLLEKALDITTKYSNDELPQTDVLFDIEDIHPINQFLKFLQSNRIAPLWSLYCNDPQPTNYTRVRDAVQDELQIALPLTLNINNMIKENSLTTHPDGQADAYEINFIMLFPMAYRLSLEMYHALAWQSIHKSFKPNQEAMERMILDHAAFVRGHGRADIWDNEKDSEPCKAAIAIIELINASLVLDNGKDLLSNALSSCMSGDEYTKCEGKFYIHTFVELWNFAYLVSSRVGQKLYHNLKCYNHKTGQIIEKKKRRSYITPRIFGIRLSIYKAVITFLSHYSLNPNCDIKRCEADYGIWKVLRILQVRKGSLFSGGYDDDDERFVIEYFLRLYNEVQKGHESSKVVRNHCQPNTLTYKIVRKELRELLDDGYSLVLRIFLQDYCVHIWRCLLNAEPSDDVNSLRVTTSDDLDSFGYNLVEYVTFWRDKYRDRLVMVSKEGEGAIELTNLSEIGIEFGNRDVLSLEQFAMTFFISLPGSRLTYDRNACSVLHMHRFKPGTNDYAFNSSSPGPTRDGVIDCYDNMTEHGNGDFSSPGPTRAEVVNVNDNMAEDGNGDSDEDEESRENSSYIEKDKNEDDPSWSLSNSVASSYEQNASDGSVSSFKDLFSSDGDDDSQNISDSRNQNETQYIYDGWESPEGGCGDETWYSQQLPLSPFVDIEPDELDNGPNNTNAMAFCDRFFREYGPNKKQKVDHHNSNSIISSNSRNQNETQHINGLDSPQGGGGDETEPNNTNNAPSQLLPKDGPNNKAPDYLLKLLQEHIQGVPFEGVAHLPSDVDDLGSDSIRNIFESLGIGNIIDIVFEKLSESDAKERDKLGLMNKLAIGDSDMSSLLQLFSPHRNDSELAAVYHPSGSGYEQVQCSNFRDLNSRKWLNDEIINFMLRKYVENFEDNIGCYSSFFMGHLLGMNEIGDKDRDIPPWSPTGYYYDAVQTWHNRFQSGLFNLEHLFVPINVGQAHWNFIHVRPREKIIELYDSYGVRESNQIYLTQFARYMHQLYRDVHGGSTVSYGSWAEEWTILDASANSPVQSDNYNCGVFVILSAYLLSLGHQLRRGSYTTQMIEDNETRLKIAHLICKGDNRSEGGTCENKNGGATSGDDDGDDDDDDDDDDAGDEGDDGYDGGAGDDGYDGDAGDDDVVLVDTSMEDNKDETEVPPSESKINGDVTVNPPIASKIQPRDTNPESSAPFQPLLPANPSSEPEIPAPSPPPQEDIANIPNEIPRSDPIEKAQLQKAISQSMRFKAIGDNQLIRDTFKETESLLTQGQPLLSQESSRL